MLMNTQRRKFNLKNLMMRLTVMYYKQTARHQTPDLQSAENHCL